MFHFHTALCFAAVSLGVFLNMRGTRHTEKSRWPRSRPAHSRGEGPREVIQPNETGCCRRSLSYIKRAYVGQKITLRRVHCGGIQRKVFHTTDQSGSPFSLERQAGCADLSFFRIDFLPEADWRVPSAPARVGRRARIAGQCPARPALSARRSSGSGPHL